MTKALGLWKTSFGAVKIEQNDQVPNGVHGVWVYDNEAGQQVIGYFAGAMRGNVLDFTWQEPGQNGAPLTGAGYLVFSPYGDTFAGRWWTSNQDRTGTWDGKRGEATPDMGGAQYGGQPYGGY